MINSIISKLTKYIDSIETAAILIFAAGTFLLTNETQHAMTITKIGLIILMSIYTIMALQRQLETESFYQLLNRKILWMSLATAILGIFLKFQSDQKSSTALLIGIITIPIAISISLLITKKQQLKINYKMITRSILIFVVSLFIYTL